MKSMLHLINKFHGNAEGNIAVMASLLLLPVLMLVGVSIDFARLNSAHGELKSSVDNTAYALARSAVPFDEKREMVAALIQANHDGSTIEVEVNRKNGGLEIAAREVVHTPLLSMIGKGDSIIEASITLGADTSTASSIGRQKSATELTSVQKAEIRRMRKRLEARMDRLMKNTRLTFDERLKLERQFKARMNSLDNLY